MSPSLRRKKIMRTAPNQAGIGTKKNGALKKNYVKFPNGKVVHVNQLD